LGRARTLRARMALLAGARHEAIAHLRAMLAILDNTSGVDFAAAAESALGALLPGDEGVALRASGAQRMRESGIVDVAGYRHAYFPELFEAG
jgi:hypothetical protein